MLNSNNEIDLQQLKIYRNVCLLFLLMIVGGVALEYHNNNIDLRWFNPFDNSQELIKEGDINMDINNFNIAITKYKEALKHNDDFSIYEKIGVCYENVFNYEDAITYYSLSLSKVGNKWTCLRDGNNKLQGSTSIKILLLLKRAELYQLAEKYTESNWDCNKVIKEYYARSCLETNFDDKISWTSELCLPGGQISKLKWAYAYKLKAINFFKLNNHNLALEYYDLGYFLYPHKVFENETFFPESIKLFNDHYRKNYKNKDFFTKLLHYESFINKNRLIDF